MTTIEEARDTSTATSSFSGFDRFLDVAGKGRPFVDIFVIAFFSALCVFVLGSALDNSPRPNLLWVAVAAAFLGLVSTAFLYVRLRILHPRVREADRFRRDMEHGFATLPRSIPMDSAIDLREEYESNLRRFSEHVTKIVEGLAAVASKQVQAEVAVSVKLFCILDNNGEIDRTIADSEPVVMTMTRDPKSRRLRATAPFRFRYSANSAFEDIVNRNDPKGYWECADLLALDRAGAYKNAHREWQSYYTSTLVIPICDRNDKGLNSLVGFLCLDSYAGDVTNPVVRRYAFRIADQLFRTMALAANVLSHTTDHA